MGHINIDHSLLSTLFDDDKSGDSISHSYITGSTSSDSSQFGVFTSKGMGMVRVDEDSEEHETIKILFTLGMGRDTSVVAVYKNLCSSSRDRLATFRSFTKSVARKNGGNANIVPAWYGGSRDEICDILLHGFNLRQPASSTEAYGVGTIHLAPLNCSFDGALFSEADENGLRHILLCRVILGKKELVSPNSKQVIPSSHKFDSGVDNHLNPRRYIIWSTYMNSHICPLFVVSFKAPLPCLTPKTPQKVSVLKLSSNELEPQENTSRRPPQSSMKKRRMTHFPTRLSFPATLKYSRFSAGSSKMADKKLQTSMSSAPQSVKKQWIISLRARLKPIRMRLPTSLKPPKIKCDKELEVTKNSPIQVIEKQKMISFPALYFKPPRMSFPTTLKLPKFKAPQMASVVKGHKVFQATKIRPPEFIQKMRLIAGGRWSLTGATFKSYKSKELLLDIKALS